MPGRYDARIEEAANREKLMQLVGFRIGKELFGVDILMVQEIIRAAPITAVPNSLDFVEGVINLRGSIIPVIELRKRIGFYTAEAALKGSWILILDIDGRVTGFIVDSVTEVLKIQESRIEPPPDIVVAGLETQYIRGVCEIDQKLLIILDFSRLLMVDEIKKLKQMHFAQAS
ncbi:MAG: purine-binding chemotaxis protein CheW [Deltaproteobacteria bacterium]|nr:purine-binding chemotaxis protein CheW [Deltaproteobacteria bacterium]